MPPGHAAKCLLIVDDSPDTRELLQRNLSSQGYEALTAADVADALKILADRHVDLVITDLKMPGTSGLDLVRHIKESLKQTEVMMITGYPSVEGAVTAMKSGAVEYLSKPFTKEELLAAVDHVMDQASRRIRSDTTTPGVGSNPLGMVGQSDVMQGVFRAIARAATAATPLLITGEHGTGKGLVAKTVHYTSPRARSPFVTVDCAGHPEEALRRLFATNTTPDTPQTRAETQSGLLRFVAGGTLHLENVATLPVAAQIPLLRLLEEEQSRLTRSSDTRGAGIRIMADSDMDLRSLVDAGVFSEELLARLSLTTIALPALRDRGDDVLLLARYFLGVLVGGIDSPVPHFTDQASAIMRDYWWPGNVGEVRSLVHQLVRIIDSGIIDVADLPAPMRYSAASAVSRHRALTEVEAEHIRGVMADVGGNKTRAAEILGINRKTLREKLKQAGPAGPPPPVS